MHKDLIEGFAFQIKKQNLNAKDVMDYINAYQLKEQKISLGPRALAKQCVGLFLYHLKEIILPDPEMGTQIGFFYIAGTAHVSNIEEFFESLQINETVSIVREENNPFDKRAIKVTTESGQKLGYIPKIHNHFPSQMIDNGSKLVGQVKKLRWKEEGV